MRRVTILALIVPCMLALIAGCAKKDPNEPPTTGADFQGVYSGTATGLGDAETLAEILVDATGVITGYYVGPNGAGQFSGSVDDNGRVVIDNGIPLAIGTGRVTKIGSQAAP
jgi:hypothetical protein